MALTDDLGAEVAMDRWPERIVSLVPSLTETLAETVRDRLVGATEWCSRPADLEVTRVRGTKNPDVDAILALEPELVVANREENRKIDVERLRAAGVAVWVTAIDSVDEAIASITRLFAVALGAPVPAWVTTAASIWASPPPLPAARVIVPIWRDPWMVIGPDTFAGDVVSRLGLVNACPPSSGRYPKIDLEVLRAAAPDLVVLPDEPYAFSGEDGPEAFEGIAVALVSGRSLTWYGPSMPEAWTELSEAIGAALGPDTRPAPDPRAQTFRR